MAISGSDITANTNVIYRLIAVVFAGIAIFAVLISWRAQALFTAEYVEFPKSQFSLSQPDQNEPSTENQLEVIQE